MAPLVVVKFVCFVPETFLRRESLEAEEILNLRVRPLFQTATEDEQVAGSIQFRYEENMIWLLRQISIVAVMNCK